MTQEFCHDTQPCDNFSSPNWYKIYLTFTNQSYGRMHGGDTKNTVWLDVEGGKEGQVHAHAAQIQSLDVMSTERYSFVSGIYIYILDWPIGAHEIMYEIIFFGFLLWPRDLWPERNAIDGRRHDRSNTIATPTGDPTPPRWRRLDQKSRAAFEIRRMDQSSYNICVFVWSSKSMPPTLRHDSLEPERQK